MSLGMAEDDELERQREDALRDVTWKASLVAADMLRVIAGAGDPLRLTQFCFELGKAIEKTPPKTFVHQVREAIERALSDGLDHSRDLSEFESAVREIERASLRIVAARLLEQSVQVSRRQNDFYHAIGNLDRVRRENRKKYEEERATSAPPTPSRKPRKAAVIKASKSPPKSAAPSPLEEDIDPNSWHSTADYMRLRRAQLKRQSGANHDEG